MGVRAVLEPTEILARIEAFACTFAARHLDSYNARLKRPGAIKPYPKEINDSLWGTIKLHPLEVILLDSPIVQRLRRVRQLGVVHWIYPGATHSRFEHTLGVLHQSQQLITAINQAVEGPANTPIDANKSALVRVCAILHDIGHGVFSHVSEHALARRTDLRLALQSFADANHLPKVQLSEVFAYYIVGSPAFIEMLAIGLDRLNQPISFGQSSADNAAAVVERAQKAIVGHHIDEQIPLLHEIITGPFDADKLDYYTRDAKQAGVPSLLDISRLLQKITVRSVAGRDLPADIRAAISNRFDRHDLFGLKWSGVAILDELHLARVLLYAKIYRHKKVLAIESMIDALFEALGTAPGVDIIRLIELCYDYCDDQMLTATAETLLRAVGVQDEPVGLKIFIENVIDRLRDRDLYVSALAILPRYPEDHWASEKPQSRGLNDLAGDCGNPQSLQRLRSEIADELSSLVELVPTAIGEMNPETLAYSVVISAKPPLGSGTEIDRALILHGERFVRGRELRTTNQAAWADAYNFGNPLAIVFAPRECAVAAYVAAERLIRRKYGVVLPPSAIELSKHAQAEVLQLKRELEQKGWYGGIPLDVRPEPDRLNKQDVAPRIDAIAARLEMVDEPKPGSAKTARRPDDMRLRIRSWLSQFRDDQLIDCGLTMLEQFRVLGREDSYAALTQFLEHHPKFKGATICPLGSLKDSGAVQAYISRDLEISFPRALTITEAVERRGDEPIVFLDDFVGSGGQVSDILVD